MTRYTMKEGHLHESWHSPVLCMHQALKLIFSDIYPLSIHTLLEFYVKFLGEF